MGTTAEKLQKILTTKSAIKQAIINKGVAVSDTDTFASYAEKIGSISSGVVTPTLQSKVVSPTTENQKVTADSGYDGLSEVTVNAVDSSIDSNITAENIKSGVSILGVNGTLEVAKGEEEKTLALSMASGNQVITPTSGKVMNKVTITKPSTLIAENIKNGIDIGGVIGTYEGSSTTITYWNGMYTDGGK